MIKQDFKIRPGLAALEGPIETQIEYQRQIMIQRGFQSGHKFMAIYTLCDEDGFYHLRQKDAFV